MAIDIQTIDSDEVTKILRIEEGHFAELKAIDIRPAKLTKTISAFANAEGGELFIGVSEDSAGHRSWAGFVNQEAANGHIQALEEFFPLGSGFEYMFLSNSENAGLVLRVDVSKTAHIGSASDGSVYVRRGAQSLKITSDEALDRLRRNKGIVSFETELVNVDPSEISNSEQIIEFILNVVPSSEPSRWLSKQQLIKNDKPTVAGIVLFADEPQALIPKRCGIKIYRYQTKDDEGARETLEFDPISVEGSAYRQIEIAVSKTADLIQGVRIPTAKGLVPAKYPTSALHEIITNAVLHRDYEITDDIHVRIFDNRVEVQSPGSLPAHITPENILSERFARNPAVVRLINKFPNPPNKDVGEGLNTAFAAMEQMRLKAPVIEQRGGSVLVVLRHESLATPQELILEYLQSHDTIKNREARDICNIGSENAMKHILQRMTEQGMLVVVKGRTVFQTSYRLPGDKG